MDPDIDLDQLAGIPSTFGGYKILELVERIGGARVFLARQTSVDRLVILTILQPQQGEKPAFKKRFERQVLAASRLSHPNVVRAVDAGSVGGNRYIASEYAGGERLSDLLAKREWIPMRRCTAIARDIAAALAHLESRLVIHRGVTPQAIILAESGVAKLRGFSLSKLQEGEASQTWFDVDTYAAQYMSPEIASSARMVDTRSDIYSFGCVLYHLLAGRPPFTGSYALEIMKKQAEMDPPDPREFREEIPDGLLALLLKCLAKSPSRRYQTAAELVTALEDLQEERVRATAQPPAAGRRGWLSRLFTTPE